MKTNLILIGGLIILLVGLTLYLQSGKPEVTKVPVPVAETVAGAAPLFDIVTIDGKIIPLSDLKGRTIILNFWATWCSPCLKEFPALLSVAARHEDKVTLVALSVDSQKDATSSFFEKLGTESRSRLKNDNVIIGFDPQMKIVQDIFQTVQFPETYVIGPDMMIRGKLVGANWTEADLEKMAGL